MALRNCRVCGRAFNDLTGRGTCPGCLQADQEQYEKVRVYLRDNPKASVQDVHEGTQVAVREILRYLREGRIASEMAGEFGLVCEGCGTPISSGRFCGLCTSRLTQDVKKTEPTQPEQQRKGQFYLQDQIRKK